MSTISNVKPSSGSISSTTQIRAAAFSGQDGCEHQAFIQPAQIITGTGTDAGSVAIQIGDVCVYFESKAALIQALTGAGSTQVVAAG